ncbi:MAG: hypothetical protein ABSA46_06345 [Thermodesulfovibrionales bacterium]
MDGENRKRRAALQSKYEFLHLSSMQRGLRMAFGFECGDGWMSLLEDLFAKINTEAKKANLTEFKVVQVKQKFGDLVVCVVKGNDAIDELIGAASKKAAATREDCSKPGRKREFNEWYSTQCSKCYTVQPAIGRP